MTTFYTYGELAARHLTGVVRHRVGWFGRMILQVQIRGPRASYPKIPEHPGKGPYSPWRSGAMTFWRDATMADIQILGDLKGRSQESCYPEPSGDPAFPFKGQREDYEANTARDGIANQEKSHGRWQTRSSEAER